MSTETLAYPQVQFERRFLIASDFQWQSIVEPYSKKLEDRYLRNSRLRVRKLTDLDTGRQVIKLTKKFESASPYFQTCSRIMLSELEYSVFENVEGYTINKVRYYLNHENNVFSIDVFEGELAGLILCECEALSLEELMAIEPPLYATAEVTEDAFFTGGNLSRTSCSDLKRKLSLYF